MNTDTLQIPTRVQASRQHKEPPGTRRVCRPSRYGNQNRVVKVSNDCYIVDYPGRASGAAEWLPLFQAHERAVFFYGLDMEDVIYDDPAFYDDLFHFAHISCFCPLDLPCHCDPIIEHLKRRAAELGLELK